MCRFTARAPPAPLTGRLDDAPEVYDDGFHWFDDEVMEVLQDADQFAPAFPSSQHGSTQEGVAPDGGSAASSASRPQELDLLALLKEELGVEGNTGAAPVSAPAPLLCDVAGFAAAGMDEYGDDDFDENEEDAIARDASTLTSSARGTPSSQAQFAAPQGSAPSFTPAALGVGALPMAPALLPEQLLAMQQQGAAALASGAPLQIVNLPFAAAGSPWLGLAQAQVAAAAAAAAVARTVCPTGSHGTSAATHPLPLHPCKASRGSHDQEALVERVKQKRRESAQRSRQRKSAYMKALEAENAAMKEELSRIKGLLASMQAVGTGMAAAPLKQEIATAQA